VHTYAIVLNFFRVLSFVRHVLFYGKCWDFLIDSIAFASLLLFHCGQSAATVLCFLCVFAPLGPWYLSFQLEHYVLCSLYYKILHFHICNQEIKKISSQRNQINEI